MFTRKRPLSDKWFWKQYDPHSDDFSKPSVEGDRDSLTGSWKPCKSFPSEIYVELLAIGRIPDPFIGFNEHAVQWVADTEWLYACLFDLEDFTAIAQNDLASEITFEGLDTICDVYLNGKAVLHTDNMFRQYSLRLVPAINGAKAHANLLVLHFRSAKRVAKQLEAQYGAVRAGSCNLGDPSRVYIRKAAYHFRWDWGPELIGAGPWKPVTLTTFAARITEAQSSACVELATQESLLAITTRVEVVKAEGLLVRACLLDDNGHTVRIEECALSPHECRLVDMEWKFPSGRIRLWNPCGYGEAYLYRLQIQLLQGERCIDQITRRIGFRDIQLLQNPLLSAPGTTFCFRINGTKIFLRGSNWIPGDCFLTKMTHGRYFSWLNLLKSGNQNCIRVWGGGIYESDAFYDICDELGILVWQDFAFACGVYPAHKEFMDTVSEEARDNLKRLRHHASLAVLCGNNEDYLQIKMWGVKGGLPAVVIYEGLLPKLVKELTSPCIPYVYGSPYGGEGDDTSDPTIGDVHQWDVWAGKGEPFQDFDILGGRFISEFGVPSLPCFRTVEAFFSSNDTSERFPQSTVIQQHTRAGSYEKRFAVLMNENFRMTGDLESYIYLTQLMQSEALGFAYRVWRRNWKGEGHEETAGVLVWQLNDCWPVTSWAICDYFLRPKPAYFSISRELKPLTVGIQRTVAKNRTNDRPRAFYEFGAFQSVAATLDIWASNFTLTRQNVRLELHGYDLQSDWTYRHIQDLLLEPNCSRDVICGMACPHGGIEGTIPTPSRSVVMAATLRDQDGRVVSQCVDWPQPFKFIQPQDPRLTAVLRQNVLEVQAERPVKGLFLSVDGGEDDVIWSENGLDIVPGYTASITITGLKGRTINAAYLGCEKRTPLRMSGQ